MRINIEPNNLHLPLRAVTCGLNSALRLTLVNIPDEATAVTVTVPAIVEGAETRLACNCTRSGFLWTASLAPNYFPALIGRGTYSVIATIDSQPTWLGTGDFTVVSTELTGSTPPPGAGIYQKKDDDLYLKTVIINDVQHFAKQDLVWDSDMEAYGLTWTGDYILVDGEFQEVE